MELLDIIAKVSWDTNKEELDSMNVSVKTANRLVSELEEKIKKLETTQKNSKSSKITKENNAETQKLRATVESITNAYKKQEAELNNLRADYNNLNKTISSTMDVGKVKKFNAELKNTSNTMQTVGAGIKNFASAFAGGFIGGGLFNLTSGIANTVISNMKTAIDEFENASRQTRQLKNILDSFGMSSSLSELVSEAERLSNVFTYIDSADLVQVQQQLLTYGKVTKDEIKKLLPVIIDLSAKMGSDLPTATQMLIMALEGNARPLKQYGISMKDAKEFTERFAMVTEDLAKKIKGTAEQFKNSSEGIRATANQDIKDVLSEYGEAISKIELLYKRAVAGAYMIGNDLITSAKEKNNKAFGKIYKESRDYFDSLSKEELDKQSRQMKLQEKEITETLKRINNNQYKLREIEQDIKNKEKNAYLGESVNNRTNEKNELKDRIKAEQEYLQQQLATRKALIDSKKSIEERERAKKEEEERVRKERNKKEEDDNKNQDNKKEKQKQAHANKLIDIQKSYQKEYEQVLLEVTLMRNRMAQTDEEEELAELSARFSKIIEAYHKAGKDTANVLELWEQKQLEIREKYNDMFFKKNPKVEMNRMSLTTGIDMTANPLSADWFSQFSYNEKQKEIEIRQKNIETIKDETFAIIDSASAIMDIEQRRLQTYINLQERRIEEAKKSSDKSVKIEQDRLTKLQAERERYETAQRIINAAVISANQALSISNAVASITTAAKTGGAAAAFTVAANVLAIVAGITAASAAIRSVNAGFKEGGYTGDGDPNDISHKIGKKSYVYHNREFVMDEELTSKYRPIFEDLHKRKSEIVTLPDGTTYISNKYVDANKITASSQNKSYTDLTALQMEMAAIKDLLKSREVNIVNNFDSNGFGVSVASALGEVRIKNKNR